MYVDRHIIFGLTFSLAIYPIIGAGSIIVFLASVLIDIDHYLYYACLTKDFSITRSIRYFLDHDVDVMFPLHAIEFIALIIVIGIFYKPFIYVFMGLGFHVLLDMYDSIKNDEFHSGKFTLLLKSL